MSVTLELIARQAMLVRDAAETLLGMIADHAAGVAAEAPVPAGRGTPADADAARWETFDSDQTQTTAPED